MAQQTEYKDQGEMCMDGVEIHPQRGVHPQVDDSLDQENSRRGGGHIADIPPVPADVAEGGGEHDAKQAHRHGVAEIED